MDVAQLAQDVCDSMAMKAKRYKKAIVCKVQIGTLMLGKTDRLRQLVINLLDNAIKYSYAHTNIQVMVGLESEVYPAARLQ